MERGSELYDLPVLVDQRSGPAGLPLLMLSNDVFQGGDHLQYLYKTNLIIFPITYHYGRNSAFEHGPQQVYFY